MSDEAVEQLLAVLDTAKDDTERTTLLTGATREAREQLKALLWYRKFIADCAAKGATEQAAFDAFSRALDESTDDNARLLLIEATNRDTQRGPTFVAEWNWRRNATVEDWRRRYLALANGEASPDLQTLSKP